MRRPDSACRRCMLICPAASDPLPFQCLVKGTPDPRLRFVDIDYADLIAVKSAVVARTPHLHSLLSHTVHHDPPAHHVHYESREYLALGCDLRDLWTLQQLFESHGLADAAVLFTAEVSLTYMDCKAVDALIEWTARLPDGELSHDVWRVSSYVHQSAFLFWSNFCPPGLNTRLLGPCLSTSNHLPPH